MPEKKKNRKKHGLPLSRRINDSFRGSLDSFLTATMLMSVVLLGAAIYISGERVHQNSPDNTQEQLPYLSSAIYDTVLSLLASVFSVFPVMLLYALMGRHGVRQKKKGHAGRSPDVHRVWLRRCVLGLIWAMAATQVYLAPRGDLSYWERHDPDADQYTDFCDQRGGTAYWNGLKAGQFLVVGAPLLWLFLTTFLITGFGIPGIQDRPWVVKWRSVWRLGIAWLNMLLMWGILGYFTRLRHKIIHTAGGLDNEDTWSFGQILALATWVPVLAEFVYIFICKFDLLANPPYGPSHPGIRPLTSHFRGHRRESGYTHARGVPRLTTRQAGSHRFQRGHHGCRSIRRQCTSYGT
jgi:hypothetical protein